MLVVNESLVTRVLTWPLAMQANEHAFILVAEREDAKQPLPDRVKIDATLFKASCGVSPSDDLGIKIVSVKPENEDKGLPTVPGFIVIVDQITGYPKAMIAATHLTAMRTAAGSALATQSLASPGASVLVVFGAGLQAEYHIRAMLHVRPSLVRVIIVNRTSSKALSLAQRMQGESPTVTFECMTNGDAVVGEADIICTCTNSATPLFQSPIPKGCHVNAVGSYMPEMQELSDDVVQSCATVVVDCPEALTQSGEMLAAARGPQPFEAKLLGRLLLLHRVHAPLPGQLHVHERSSLFKSVGVSIQDIAVANVILEELRKPGQDKELVMIKGLFE